MSELGRMANFALGLVRWLRQKVDEKKIRESTLAAVPYAIAAGLVGLMAVAYAKLFQLAERSAMELFRSAPHMIFVVAPVAFLLSWWLVKKLAPAAGGSGIPQLMAAAELAGRDAPTVAPLLGARMFMVKTLSSLVCVLGGGAIGREGPTLQLAGSTFYLTHRFLKRVGSRYIPVAGLQSMIITGGAAGLAAAFNTPLGGIVYAIEELAKIHLSFFRTSLIHAVIVSGLVAQFMLGSYLYLGYPVVRAPEPAQLPAVILVAALVGAGGALMGRALFRLGQARKALSSQRSEIVFVAGVGLAFAGLAYFAGLPALGSGKEVLNELLFTETHADWTWPVARLFGNLLSYGSGAAGGVFAPALASGAALASLVSTFLPGLDPHMLVLIGMIAFLTGLTRTPFTSFVLVLEMTDRHSVILPMMISAMAANAVAHLIEPESLYEKLKGGFLPQHVPEKS